MKYKPYIKNHENYHLQVISSPHYLTGSKHVCNCHGSQWLCKRSLVSLKVVHKQLLLVSRNFKEATSDFSLLSKKGVKNLRI